MKQISILAGKQISLEHISQAIQLDRIVYEDIYRLEADTCVDYWSKNQDIYIMAVDNMLRQVVGYINFSPIEKEMFSLLMSGCVVDTVITKKEILTYQSDKSYWAYFSSIAVHPEYRLSGIAKRMLFYWSNLIYQLATEKCIYFNGIIADAVSSDGEKLLSKIGFEVIKPSSHNSKIMMLNLFAEQVIRTEYTEKIINAYEIYKKEGGI